MNSKIVLLLAFFLLIQGMPGLAQKTSLDSLLQAKDDTMKVRSLFDPAFNMIGTDQKKAIELYQTIYSISEKIDYSYGIGIALLNLGIINGTNADDKLAYEKFKAAIPYFRKARRLDFLAMCYLNIGSCAERFGEVDTSITYTMKAVEVLEGTKYKDMLAHSYNSLGTLFFNMNDYSKGLRYFQKALPVAREAVDTVKQVYAFFGMGNCLSSMKDYDGALGHALEALRLAQAKNDHYVLSVANVALSEIYLKMKNGRQAIEHAGQILHHAEASNDMHYRLIAFQGLADGWGLLNDQHKRIYYLNKALEIGEEKGITVQLDDVYKSLAEAYEELGLHQQAYQAYKKHIVFRDSSNNVTNQKTVQELEISYQTAQKEKDLSEKQLQIAHQDLQLQKSRQFSTYSVATAVVAFLVAFLIYADFRNKRKLHARQLREVQQEKEIQVLHAIMQGEERERSRISKGLHDGVAGMLAAVKMHLNSLQQPRQEEERVYQQAISLLDEATTEVRKTAHNLMPEVLLQHGLDEALRRYCGNISNEHTLVVQYDSWGETGRYSSGFELSVYRIVQELLNNIIKHSKATHAIVQMNQHQGILSITVEDDGVGFSAAKPQADGMGLSTLRSRVEAINGKMKVEAAAGSGVSAYLEFNVAAHQKAPQMGTP